MKRLGGLVGLVIALGIGFFIFKAQYTTGPAGGAPPQEVIDVMGVRSDLLAMAQAERMYLASNGTYASLEQLQQDGGLTFSGANRRGYNYVAEVDGGQHFRITAMPVDPAKAAWPTLWVDESLQISQQ